MSITLFPPPSPPLALNSQISFAREFFHSKNHFFSHYVHVCIMLWLLLHPCGEREKKSMGTITKIHNFFYDFSSSAYVVKLHYSLIFMASMNRKEKYKNADKLQINVDFIDIEEKGAESNFLTSEK